MRDETQQAQIKCRPQRPQRIQMEKHTSPIDDDSLKNWVFEKKTKKTEKNRRSTFLIVITLIIFHEGTKWRGGQKKERATEQNHNEKIDR